VRADGIVIFTPDVEDDLCFGDGREDVAIQTLVAQLPIKAFDEGILYRLVRPHEIEAHVMRVRPRVMARLTNSPPLSTVIAWGARRRPNT
jgi:hypothetical protein